MELNDCKLLIIYGGSFDPPHQAHTTLPFIAQKIICAKAKIDIEQSLVGFMPAALSPFKTAAPPTLAKHRLAMLKLALENKKNATIITDEIDHFKKSKPSYTIDTITELKKRLPDSTTMRLLIGMDQMVNFGKWKDYKQILSLAKPAVMMRPDYDINAIINQLPKDERAMWQEYLIDMPKLDISATNIRKLVKNNQPIDGLVAPKVAKYIKEHNLYC